MADYVKPFDATDPNASFVNGNPSSGVAGSIPDALMWEVWQRELVYVIQQGGLTPSNNDLHQVWKSIQYAVSQGSSTYINSLSIVGGRLAFYSTSGFWQCPAGVTKARVTAQGGGGGGGGGNGYAGAGGLGGNSFEGVFDVTPGTQYACNVGAGGVAGGAGGGGAPGGNGQTTSFGPQGGTSLAAALGGTGGGSGGNPASGYVGISGAAPGLSGIIFPHGGYELAGGGAQNGILLPNGGLNIPLGGIGGGARYSATTPFPVANGRFDANGYGGGGSGGANADPGGRGAGGLLIIEY